MIILDYVLLAILAYFTIWGLRKGLIRAVGSLFGLVIAIVLSSRYYEQVTEFVAPFLGGVTENYNLIRALSFIVLLVGISRLVLLLVAAVEKVYKSIAVLPFMKLANRLLGGVLGLIEGSIVLGLALYFIGQFPFGSIVETYARDSHVVPLVVSISTIVQPLLPDALTSIQGLF